MKIQKISIALISVIVLACLLIALEPFKPREKIIFLGDSITQAGVRPEGYITLVSEAIDTVFPDKRVKLIGAGISGNKVSDCLNRLQHDVLRKKPNRVIIYIGINDVWHWTHPKIIELGGRGTTPEEFENGLKSMIQQISAIGAKVILCTPTVIGEKKNGANQSDEMLDEFSDISRKVAKESGVQLIDLRKAFTSYLNEYNLENVKQGILTIDGVHLNKTGNTLVANLVIEALEDSKR